ncbi:hypothetical protein T8S45_04925 [Blastomonas marina]|uniref:hypothetical protein n=1 Tax=Blastomonas marina TaxID=1867408 RepID=UPI002AC9E48A|nr:hypothetical protein [Blastomonas marina]WPZ04884.1 hypothetical protein T8S45_04925 [Blastomonas marina]
MIDTIELPVAKVAITIALLFIGYISIQRTSGHDARVADGEPSVADCEGLGKRWQNPAASLFGVAAFLLAAFLWTPWAERIARSPEFVPFLIAAFFPLALLITVRGAITGKVLPLMSMAFGPYVYKRQPRRFVASMIWNILISGLTLFLALDAWDNIL